MSVDLPKVGIALLALLVVPVALYILDTSTTFVALSLVSVVLVVASLWLMFGRSEAAAAEAGAS
jgi:hypothetical protein